MKQGGSLNMNNIKITKLINKDNKHVLMKQGGSLDDNCLGNGLVASRMRRDANRAITRKNQPHQNQPQATGSSYVSGICS